MSSINENSNGENRGASQVIPVNNFNNINTSYVINNIFSNTFQNFMNHNHYCAHCRSYGNHLEQNCNHVTLRIFEHECFRKKEELVESNEQYKLLAFEDFIYKFHIEIINGFYRKKCGYVLRTQDENVEKIMEYFWHPEVYTNDWTIFNDLLDNGIGWFTDRIGNNELTITQQSFIYPSSMTNSDLLNRIMMANVLMNELIVNEQEELNFINMINNIPRYNNETHVEAMPDLISIEDNQEMSQLVDANDPLVQVLIETQNQTHFAEDYERRFNINAYLILSEDLEELEEAECQICYDSKNRNRFVKLNCNHEYCAPCIIQTMNNTSQYREPCCAFCRATMTDFTVFNEEDFQTLQERIM